jgi:hypothetical protein
MPRSWEGLPLDFFSTGDASRALIGPRYRALVRTSPVRCSQGLGVVGLRSNALAMAACIGGRVDEPRRPGKAGVRVPRPRRRRGLPGTTGPVGPGDDRLTTVDEAARPTRFAGSVLNARRRLATQRRALALFRSSGAPAPRRQSIIDYGQPAQCSSVLTVTVVARPTGTAVAGSTATPSRRARSITVCYFGGPNIASDLRATCGMCGRWIRYVGRFASEMSVPGIMRDRESAYLQHPWLRLAWEPNQFSVGTEHQHSQLPLTPMWHASDWDSGGTTLKGQRRRVITARAVREPYLEFDGRLAGHRRDFQVLSVPLTLQLLTQAGEHSGRLIEVILLVPVKINIATETLYC